MPVQDVLGCQRAQDRVRRAWCPAGAGSVGRIRLPLHGSARRSGRRTRSLPWNCPATSAPASGARGRSPAKWVKSKWRASTLHRGGFTSARPGLLAELSTRPRDSGSLTWPVTRTAPSRRRHPNSPPCGRRTGSLAATDAGVGTSAAEGCGADPRRKPEHLRSDARTRRLAAPRRRQGECASMEYRGTPCARRA